MVAVSVEVPIDAKVQNDRQVRSDDSCCDPNSAIIMLYDDDKKKGTLPRTSRIVRIITDSPATAAAHVLDSMWNLLEYCRDQWGDSSLFFEELPSKVSNPIDDWDFLVSSSSTTARTTSQQQQNGLRHSALSDGDQIYLDAVDNTLHRILHATSEQQQHSSNQGRDVFLLEEDFLKTVNVHRFHEITSAMSPLKVRSYYHVERSFRIQKTDSGDDNIVVVPERDAATVKQLRLWIRRSVMSSNMIESYETPSLDFDILLVKREQTPPSPSSTATSAVYEHPCAFSGSQVLMDETMALQSLVPRGGTVIVRCTPGYDELLHISNSLVVSNRSSSTANTMMNAEHQPFQLQIKTLTGRTLSFQVQPWFTIQMVQHLIYQEERIPMNQQRLILKGAAQPQLQNVNMTLLECGITPASTGTAAAAAAAATPPALQLFLILRMGMFHRSSAPSPELTSTSSRSSNLLSSSSLTLRLILPNGQTTSIRTQPAEPMTVFKDRVVSLVHHQSSGVLIVKPPTTATASHRTMEALMKRRSFLEQQLLQCLMENEYQRRNHPESRAQPTVLHTSYNSATVDDRHGEEANRRNKAEVESSYTINRSHQLQSELFDINQHITEMEERRDQEHSSNTKRV